MASKVRLRDEGSPYSRWYVPALAPLSEALHPGETNTIVARVYNLEQAGGLWRGVRVLEPKRLDDDPLTTPAMITR